MFHSRINLKHLVFDKSQDMALEDYNVYSTIILNIFHASLKFVISSFHVLLLAYSRDSLVTLFMSG